MNRSRPADHPLATQQWSDLRNLLVEVGADVSTLTPEPGLPDLVFTANAAIVFEQRVILSNFRHSQRQLEMPINERWFCDHGFQVERLPESVAFEGAGDALFCGDTLFGGYHIRSHVNGHQEVAARLGCRAIPMMLRDDYYYHLDTCFCPLAPGLAIYYPGAFDTYGLTVLQEYIEQLIPVVEPEARRFACNAVVVGKTVVTNTGCPQLHLQLRELGYETRETPLSEFVKAGGSAKCLTLRLDGEEAAAWKQEL